MATVEYERVEKVYPGGTPALTDLNLHIADGELMVLVGPSGCGKSTALRLLAGLEELSGGTLRIGDRVVNGLPPQARNVAMVFQDYALYPHMSVRENLEFPLKMRRLAREEVQRRVERVAAMLDLGEWLERLPRQLSGGQRQRVAMGRALVREPAAFLLDEPLSNLDARLRVQVRAELGELQRRTGTTMIYVTHDQTEAMTLGHRVAVLHRGRLQQVAPPRALYEQPANTFVAGFIGNPPMNLFPVRLLRTEAGIIMTFAGQHIALARARAGALEPYLDRSLTAGVRAETFRQAGEDRPGTTVIVRVDQVEYLGHELLVYGRTTPVAGAQGMSLVARLSGGPVPVQAQTLRLSIDPAAVHIFDEDGIALSLPHTADPALELV